MREIAAENEEDAADNIGSAGDHVIGLGDSEYDEDDAEDEEEDEEDDEAEVVYSNLVLLTAQQYGLDLVGSIRSIEELIVAVERKV